MTRLGADGHGFVEALMHDLIPRLPEAALAPLDAALADATPPASEGRAGGQKAWASQLARSRLVRMRQALADRAGDVDAFIAFEQAVSPEQPDRVRIAERLLGAGRAPEALDWIRRPQKRGPVVVTREALLTGQFDHDAPERARQAVEIRILDSLGQTEAAQTLRWEAFARHLDPAMLRAYLAKLPDFEDDEALARAFDQAQAHPDRYRALAFFTHWPNPARAARLVDGPSRPLGRRAATRSWRPPPRPWSGRSRRRQPSSTACSSTPSWNTGAAPPTATPPATSKPSTA